MKGRLTILTLLIGLGPVIWIIGCEADLYVTANSSNEEDDYFEEPVPSKFRRLEPALETSNLFIDLLYGGRIDDLYKTFDQTLRQNVSPDELRTLRQKLLSQFGPVIEYKRSQWGFSSRREIEEDVVYSIKIVVHENSEAFYILRFIDDGNFTKISAFSIQPRRENERVKQAVDRLIAGRT